MWTLVHPLDILFRWITETIQDIVWLLRYPEMTVGHPWDKVCCVGLFFYFKVI